MGLVDNLLKSPTVQAALVIWIMFLASCFIFDATTITDIVDCFSIAATGMLAYTFRGAFCEAIQAKKPTRRDLVIAGMVIVAVSYGLIRLCRAVAVELGVLRTDYMLYIFGAWGALFVFGALLQVAAVGHDGNSIGPSAWWALGGVIVSGTFTSIIVMAIRWAF